EYKNHQVIVEAFMLLKMQDMSDFKVIFTLNGNENNHITKLFSSVKANNLPIEFIGEITHDKVLDFYSRSILVFPSYIETFGLPLLEAKMHGTLILASDCPFSHEILDDYRDVRFFKSNDSHTLAMYIKDCSSIKGALSKQ